MRYLVCVDGSQDSEAAFNRAVELYEIGDRLIVLLVQSNKQINRVRDIAIVHRYSVKCLDKYNSNIIAERKIGSIGDTIIRVAKEMSVDSIIIGRRGRSKVRQIFGGSVSNYVLRHARGDVIVVNHEKLKPGVGNM